MKSGALRVFIAILVAFVAVAAAQAPQAPDADVKLPSGKSQREEILKADHQKSLDDAAELAKLTEELRIELEKNDRHVVSVRTLKTLDEIEKLARRIRGRLKRY
jgi:hypothetical protein